jgi:hypothetical protein
MSAANKIQKVGGGASYDADDTGLPKEQASPKRHHYHADGLQPDCVSEVKRRIAARPELANQHFALKHKGHCNFRRDGRNADGGKSVEEAKRPRGQELL